MIVAIGVFFLAIFVGIAFVAFIIFMIARRNPKK